VFGLSKGGRQNLISERMSSAEGTRTDFLIKRGGKKKWNGKNYET